MFEGEGVWALVVYDTGRPLAKGGKQVQLVACVSYCSFRSFSFYSLSSFFVFFFFPGLRLMWRIVYFQPLNRVAGQSVGSPPQKYYDSPYTAMLIYDIQIPAQDGPRINICNICTIAKEVANTHHLWFTAQSAGYFFSRRWSHGTEQMTGKIKVHVHLQRHPQMTGILRLCATVSYANGRRGGCVVWHLYLHISSHRT